jgi:hypothetical protein
MFGSQPSGVLRERTGSGPDTISLFMTEAVETTWWTPGTTGDTTWTGTLTTDKTCTVVFGDGNTLSIQATGITTQDGPGTGLENADLTKYPSSFKIFLILIHSI